MLLVLILLQFRVLSSFAESASGIRVLSSFAESASGIRVLSSFAESASGIRFRNPHSGSAFYPNPKYIGCEPRRHFRRSFFAWKITSAETSENSISTNQNVAPKNCELTREILVGNAWNIRGIFTRQKNANDNNKGPDTPNAIRQRDAIFRFSLTDNFDPSLNFPYI
jgi:hypothetical protein